MKSLAYIFLIAVLSMISCSKFLDIEPQDEISNAEALGSLDAVNRAVIAIYNALGQNSYYGEMMVLYPEYTGGNIKPSDNAIMGTVGVDESGNVAIESYRNMYNFTNAAQDGGRIANAYAHIYVMINRANNIINAIPNIEDSRTSLKDNYLGEALFFRALGHFDLLRLYAQPYNFTNDASHIGIAVLRKTPTVFERPSRGTVQEAYDLIIEDLTQAIELITTAARRGGKNTIWLSPNAAKGLLARVYLYQGNWSMAFAVADEAIQAGIPPLTAHGNYTTQWLNGFNLSESIFEMDLSQVIGTSHSNFIGDGTERPFATFTQDFLNKFQTGDVRLTLYRDNTIGDVATLKYPFLPNQSTNVPIIRSSELYLIRAEAAFELGNEAAALNDLNTLLERANPGFSAGNISGEELLEEIRNERRRELAVEGHLFFDLARRNLDVNRIDCRASNPNCLLAFPDFRFVLPIPQRQLDVNPNTVQNEGY